LAEFSVRSVSRRCSTPARIASSFWSFAWVSACSRSAAVFACRRIAQCLLGRLRELREPVAERRQRVALPLVERGELLLRRAGELRQPVAHLAAERLRRLRLLGPRDREVLPQLGARPLHVLLEVALEVLALGPDDGQVAAEGLDPLVERIAGASEGG
jgi:hypothetical protein